MVTGSDDMPKVDKPSSLSSEEFSYISKAKFFESFMDDFEREIRCSRPDVGYSTLFSSKIFNNFSCSLGW